MSRGQFDLGRKALYMVVVVFVLIFIFFYMSTLMNNHFAKTVKDVDRISTEIIASNLLVSSSCLAYEDPKVSRTYIGVIDLEKLTVNLGSCLPYNDRPFRVSVAGKEINFGLKEGTSSVSLKHPVLVRDGADSFYSVLVVEAGYVR
ncbi:MAG: hypothetical protein V1914_04370 [archaeon]